MNVEIQREIYRASEFARRKPLQMLNDDIFNGKIDVDQIVSIVSHGEGTADEVLVVYYKE